MKWFQPLVGPWHVDTGIIACRYSSAPAERSGHGLRWQRPARSIARSANAAAALASSSTMRRASGRIPVHGWHSAPGGVGPEPIGVVRLPALARPVGWNLQPSAPNVTAAHRSLRHVLAGDALSRASLVRFRVRRSVLQMTFAIVAGAFSLSAPRSCCKGTLASSYQQQPARRDSAVRTAW